MRENWFAKVCPSFRRRILVTWKDSGGLEGEGERWRKKNVTESVAYDVGFTMLAREFSEIEKDLNLTPFTNPCTTFSSDIRFPRKYERAR